MSSARAGLDSASDKSGHRAFTLIEIMIAIGIFSLVLLAIYTSWTAILRGTKAGLDAAREAQRIRVSMQVIRDSLISVRLFTENAELYAFEADTSGGRYAALSFVSNLAPSFPRSGRFGDLVVRRVTFEVEPGSDGKNQLVLRQVPLLLEMDDDERDHPLVLARDVSLFQLEFWDDVEQDWVDEWTLTNQLPKQVKISLGVSGDTTRTSEPKRFVTELVALPATAIQATSQRPQFGPVRNQ